MKAIKRPIPITVVVFDPTIAAANQWTGLLRPKVGRGWEIWNERHASWIGVQPGDYLNVSDPGDVYPIAKGVFDATYDIVDETFKG